MSRNIYHLKCSSVILHKSTNRKEVITMVRKIQRIKLTAEKANEICFAQKAFLLYREGVLIHTALNSNR